MSVTFVTNEDLAVIDGKVDELLLNASFRKVTGSFTPSEDTYSLSLTGLPSNVKTLEMRPTSDVGDADMEVVDGAWVTHKVPINYFCFTTAPGNGGREGHTGVYVQFSVLGTLRGDNTRVVTYDKDAGTVRCEVTTADNDEKIRFIGGVTYNWTAYCWDD